jgi:hypothetical protein
VFLHVVSSSEIKRLAPHVQSRYLALVRRLVGFISSAFVDRLEYSFVYQHLTLESPSSSAPQATFFPVSSLQNPLSHHMYTSIKLIRSRNHYTLYITSTVSPLYTREGLASALLDDSFGGPVKVGNMRVSLDPSETMHVRSQV